MFARCVAIEAPRPQHVRLADSVNYNRRLDVAKDGTSGNTRYDRD